MSGEFSSSSGAFGLFAFYKNGTLFGTYTGALMGTPNTFAVTHTATIYLNVTSDYVQAYGLSPNSTLTIFAGGHFFEGRLVRYS